MDKAKANPDADFAQKHRDLQDLKMLKKKQLSKILREEQTKKDMDKKDNTGKPTLQLGNKLAEVGKQPQPIINSGNRKLANKKVTYQEKGM